MNWAILIPIITSIAGIALGYFYNTFQNRKTNAYYSRRINSVNAEMLVYKERISKLETELETERYNSAPESNPEIELQLEKSNSRINELEAQLKTYKAKKETPTTLSDIEDYKQQILELEKDIKHSAVKMLRLEGQIEVRKNDLENNENAVLRAQQEKLQLELGIRNNAIQQLENELDLYIANYTELNAEAEEKESSLKEKMAKLETELKTNLERTKLIEEDLKDKKEIEDQLLEKNNTIIQLEVELLHKKKNTVN